MQAQTANNSADARPEKVCVDDCKTKNGIELSCKLTSAALRQRKETVIKSFKAQVVSRKELENGFSYAFAGSDETIDELIEFIKTERLCCEFFNFNLVISGSASEARLEITGPEGVKGFIVSELDF